MLYHITATHTPDNCPLYNTGLRAACGEAMEKFEANARESGVKLHFSVSGAPDHVFYHLVEAESLQAIGAWLASVPIPQEFRITPVQPNVALPDQA
jgi:hypothetical protein